MLDGSEEAKSIPQNDPMEKMKDLINECATNVEEVKIRINVRRKSLMITSQPLRSNGSTTKGCLI